MYRGNYEGVEHPSAGSFLHGNMAVFINFLYSILYLAIREEKRARSANVVVPGS